MRNSSAKVPPHCARGRCRRHRALRVAIWGCFEINATSREVGPVNNSEWVIFFLFNYGWMVKFSLWFRMSNYPLACAATFLHDTLPCRGERRYPRSSSEARGDTSLLIFTPRPTTRLTQWSWKNASLFDLAFGPQAPVRPAGVTGETMKCGPPADRSPGDAITNCYRRQLVLAWFGFGRRLWCSSIHVALIKRATPQPKRMNVAS